MEKIKCVLYARYSSDNQREVSAEEQIKHCKEYAERMEFEVVGEYIDKAMTGTNANRKNFLRMIEDSKSRTFRYVIVYANNRFARNRYDKQYYKRELQKNGVDILYSTQEILNGNSPDSILYESLDDGISEWYSRNLAVEVMKKGHLPNAQKCLHNGGTAPFGYNVVNQRLVLNADEAPVVKMIFDWYVFNGYGYNRIAKELNERGLRNKAGEAFKGTSIRDMLLNEKYTGTYVYNKRSSYDSMGKRNNSKLKDDSQIIRIEGAFDAIVSREVFDKVKGAMESRKGRNASNQAQEVYLLSGLVKCGLCGHNLHGNRKPSNRNGSHHITYKCNNRDKNGIKVCHNKEVNKIYLERAIMHFISQMCEGDNFQTIMRELQRYAKEQNEGSGELQFLETKYNKVDREISNIIKAIKGGFDAEELMAEYAILKEDKTKLSAQIEIERQKQAQRIDIDEASVRKALSRISADICESKPIEEYKQLFSSFVERVDVFEDYVTIVLKVFDMINVHVCNGSGLIIEEPPLDLHQMVVWNGGAEGNRTPVRKQLGRNFSGRSLLFTFPHPGGNKHPTGISSFMMRGMGKAYHTHVLHSDDTQARLVDLPGRMRA